MAYQFHSRTLVAHSHPVNTMRVRIFPSVKFYLLSIFIFPCIHLSAAQNATDDDVIEFVNTHGSGFGEQGCACNPKTKDCTCRVLETDGSIGVYETDCVTAARVLEELHRDHQNSSRIFPYLILPQTFKYDDPRLGTLTKNNPVVRSVQFYPMQPKDIGIRFVLFYQKSGREMNTTLKLTDNGKQNLPAKCDKLIIFIHGFNNNIEDQRFKSLKTYLLKYYENKRRACPVLLDWSAGASALVPANILSFNVYGQPAVNTITVGRVTAVLLKQLVDSRQITLDNVYLIGFSLGAQVTHAASQWLKNIMNQRNGPIGRITGLDPAARHFQDLRGSFLNKDDAAFVDVIHTSMVNFDGGILDTVQLKLGTRRAIGTVDFFPNGGTVPQPPCQLLSSCSHGSSVMYFTQSLEPKTNQGTLVSLPCASFNKYRQCEKKKKQLESQHEYNIMGIGASAELATGKLYNTFDAKKKGGKGEGGLPMSLNPSMILSSISKRV